MQRWRWPFLGIDEIPAWLTGFEAEQFFRLAPAELAVVRTRHGTDHQVGLALQIGFLRMSGRVLNSTTALPAAALRLIGEQLGIRVPRLTSLRALYGRKPTLHEHQNLAKQALGFRALGEHAKRMLIAHLRAMRGATIDPAELATRARVWLYEHRYLIPGERAVLGLARAVLDDSEMKLLRDIERAVPSTTRKRWFEALAARRPEAPQINGAQWLKGSVRARRGQSLTEAFHKIQHLLALHVDRVAVPEIPLALAKAYAGRLARTKLVRFARLRPATRTIAIVYFMKISLWRAADDAIEAWLMRVSELRREAYAEALRTAEAQWQARFQALVEEIEALATGPRAADQVWRTRLHDACQQAHQRAQVTRTDRVRHAWLGRYASVRRLLRLMLMLPVECVAPQDRLLAEAVETLRALYAKSQTRLPDGAPGGTIARMWDPVIAGADRAVAMRALEVAVLQRLYRGLRNGSISVSATLSYRQRESLLIPSSIWRKRRATFAAALGVTEHFTAWSQSLKSMIAAGLIDLARAARKGRLDIGLNGVQLPRDPVLACLAPDEEDEARRRIAESLGPIELPRLMLEVDGLVRFSWILLNRAPSSTAELQALYGALLAHGAGLDRTEVLRMIPGVADRALALMMRLLEDDERLREANTALVQFMQQYRIVEHWGEGGFASSDMMALEATRRLWNARIDPRSRVPAIGTYTHVLDRWGIAYDQPIVLNRRQAGAAIEGALRQRASVIERLAVDTHGYTDVAMGLAKLLGFDLCPRLAMLKDRKLVVPRGQYVPRSLSHITESVRLQPIETQWDNLLRVAASLKDGWCSATQVLERLGTQARGDPLYQAAVALGRLVRTAYLCDYFTKPAFRGAIRRVLNHGEAVHALQRRIRTGSIGPKRGRSRDEQIAISGSLSLLANLVMVWNTHNLQRIADRSGRYARPIDMADLAELGPVSTRHINFRGVLHFPLAEFEAPILGTSAARCNASKQVSTL